jgi:CspA family cold shock protein
MNTLTESRIFSTLIMLGIALIAALAISQIQSAQLIESTALRFVATTAIIFIVILLASLLPRKTATNAPTSALIDEPLTPPARETGHVKWFNSEKGFGFIVRENGEDLFVHFRAVGDGSTLQLVEGQKVEYHIGQGRKGPQAEQVVVLG